VIVMPTPPPLVLGRAHTPEELAILARIVDSTGALFEAIDARLARVSRVTYSARGRADLAAARECLAALRGFFVAEHEAVAAAAHAAAAPRSGE
jgi:MoxR-like ATPase